MLAYYIPYPRVRFTIYLFFLQFFGFESLENFSNLLAIFLEFNIILKKNPKKLFPQCKNPPQKKRKKEKKNTL
jgi:hypothetical protein